MFRAALLLLWVQCVVATIFVDKDGAQALLPTDRDGSEHQLSPRQPLRILVIGGSGFMGRATVELLADQGHSVSVLNRGHTRPQGYPGVRHIANDRFNDRAGFRRHLSGSAWDVVIDFISFNPESTSDVIQALQGTSTHLIHLSTISAYEPSLDNKGLMGARDHSVPHVVEEDMFVLRSSEELQQRRIKARAYGGNKFLVEKLLWSVRDRLNFTSLRIPECIGARSDERHWFYQTWVKSGLPVWLHPQTGKLPFRLNYGPDTARVISRIIAAGQATHGQAFNMAQDEVITMEDYVEAIHTALGLKYVPVVFREDAPQVGLPSATFGPLDTSKVAGVLPGWRPTPMSEFIVDTVAWWESAENTAGKPNKLPQNVWDAAQQHRRRPRPNVKADL